VKKLIGLLALSSLLLSGCTSLRTVSLTTIPAQRNNVVKAEASKLIFLGFNFDNDFVDDMEAQLKRQCQNGVVTGILTKEEVVDYFLFIVYSHKVNATGYCVKGNSTAENSSSLVTPETEAQAESIEEMFK
jgi:hypothetical protein